jgi:hypothetical protein
MKLPAAGSFLAAAVVLLLLCLLGLQSSLTASNATDQGQLGPSEMAPPQPASLQVSVTWTNVSATGLCGSGNLTITVQFFANATGGDPPYAFYWAFSDSSLGSTLQDPEHTYAGGTLNVTLTVTDSQGVQTSKTVTLGPIVVNCPSIGPTPPMAPPGWAAAPVIVGSTLGIAMGLVTFRGSRKRRTAN